MAIDQTNDYASAMLPGCPWRPALPIPSGDSVISDGDLQHVSFLYAGIEAAAPDDSGQPARGRWSAFIRWGHQQRIANGRY